MLGTLHLRDFRNYADVDWDPSPGLNLVVGRNAQGKTNLLEAAYLLATGQLLRGQRDAEAIREGSDEFRVTGDLDGGRTTLGVQLVRGGRKRATLNGVALPRASDLMGRLPCVAFGAGDLEIVRGEPEDRRRFLDLSIPQLRPAYLKTLAGYKRALDQRNRLLKLTPERPVSDDEFDVWEAEMATYGAGVRQARQAWIADLRETATALAHELSGGEGLGLALDTKGEDGGPDELRTEWESRRGVDIARGSTSVGPHRDDLILTVDGRSLRLYGSQGQQRTVAIALKLGTLAVMRQSLGLPPLVLLDDVFAELDADRRSRLLDLALHLAGQVILTGTEAKQAGESMLSQAQVVRVEAGRLSVVGEE